MKFKFDEEIGSLKKFIDMDKIEDFLDSFGPLGNSESMDESFENFSESVPENDSSSPITERDKKVIKKMCPQNSEEKKWSKTFLSFLEDKTGVSVKSARKEIQQARILAKLTGFGSKIFHGATRKQDVKEVNDVCDHCDNILTAACNPLNHIVPSRRREIMNQAEKLYDYAQNSEAFRRLDMDSKTFFGFFPPQKFDMETSDLGASFFKQENDRDYEDYKRFYNKKTPFQKPNIPQNEDYERFYNKKIPFQKPNIPKNEDNMFRITHPLEYEEGRRPKGTVKSSQNSLNVKNIKRKGR